MMSGSCDLENREAGSARAIEKKLSRRDDAILGCTEEASKRVAYGNPRRGVEKIGQAHHLKLRSGLGCISPARAVR
jgi:hypothetical protein